jgi:dehydrogenase/reductase SDR family protein 7
MMIQATQITYFFAVGATALTLFANMDANPSLYVHDFFLTERRLNNFFNQKTMWITGASSGIGAEMAKQLSCLGVNLILSARSSEKLKSVAEVCSTEKGNTISVLPLDLTCTDDELESAVEKVLELVGTSGNLDFVVLNAGRGQLKPESLMTRKESQDMFQINTLAPIALTQMLLRKKVLQQGKGNNLMVTSSIGGKLGLPLSASYAASKHALHGYFESLKAECPWMKIDLVCPGPIDTEFHGKREKSSKPRKELKMPASRCARLMVSSFLTKGGEHYISEHPSLVGLYLKQFFPSFFQSILCRVGPLRIKAWEQGLNLYDPQTWKDIRKRKP